MYICMMLGSGMWIIAKLSVALARISLPHYANIGIIGIPECLLSLPNSWSITLSG